MYFAIKLRSLAFPPFLAQSVHAIILFTGLLYWAFCSVNYCWKLYFHIAK